MKKIVVLIFIMLYFSTMAMACEKNRYNIYYIDLEDEFFIPLTREDIIQNGTNFEIDSCNLTILFEKVIEKKERGKSTDLKDLRILVVRKKDSRELFITAVKKIVYKNKEYKLDSVIVNDVLLEIDNYIKENKLEY